MRNPLTLIHPYLAPRTLYRVSVIKMFIGIDFTFTNKVFIKLVELDYEN